MKNTWFEETFLQSLIEKAENNIKYKNQIILSEKQADICYKYMNHKECSTDYGWMGYSEYEIDGYSCTVQNRGRYTFLNISKTIKKKQKDMAKEIKKEIDKLEYTLDILYEDEENNISEIERIENIIDELWNDYNETLKIK